jgi:hypothetical protein
VAAKLHKRIVPGQYVFYLFYTEIIKALISDTRAFTGARRAPGASIFPEEQY